MEFPVLLDDQLVPRLKVYSKESTIAEKFQSLVKLNILTSRMKDIYDILFLASHQAFDKNLLHKAIVKTFNRRGTPIEDRKSIFTNEFKSSKGKQTQWTAFLRRSHLESYTTFTKAIDHLELFLEPVCSRESLSSGDQVTWSSEKWRWQ